MLRIAPFKGVLYNREKVPLDKVVAPPYDIISPLEQKRFYELHPANVIRLILGKTFPGDNSNNNRYKRAAKFYADWLRNGTLVLDDIPSIYIYRVDFMEEGRKKTRIGFIALASLKGTDRKLIPHERTFSGPKKDRLNLMRACRTNFSQIFTLYSDSKNRITRLLKPFMDKTPPIKARYKDEEHFIWKLSDCAAIDKIKKIIQNKDIFIADGHHRYETALAFSREMMKKNYGYSLFPGSHYAMLYFSNMDEEGLSIYPTHRLVKEGSFEKERLKKLEEFFDIVSFRFKSSASFKKALRNAAEILKKERQSFGLLAGGKKEINVFILKDMSFIRRFIKGDFSDTKRNLSVTIVDEGVLKGFLKINNFEKNISYTRDAEDARGKIEKGHFSHAFLLNSATLKELKAIASVGERMPHKSTYFYPKLISGFIIYDQERSLRALGKEPLE